MNDCEIISSFHVLTENFFFFLNMIPYGKCLANAKDLSQKSLCNFGWNEVI